MQSDGCLLPIGAILFNIVEKRAFLEYVLRRSRAIPLLRLIKGRDLYFTLKLYDFQVLIVRA